MMASAQVVETSVTQMIFFSQGKLTLLGTIDSWMGAFQSAVLLGNQADLLF